MRARQEAVREILERYAHHKKEGYQKRGVIDYFGENVFNEEAQRKRLSPHVFGQLQEILSSGKELDLATAETIAAAMLDWALEKGASHFCHWFQPLTDLTAEKHDSFFIPSQEGGALLDFSGSHLVRGEPDASSFPSGGLRTTFEARGYTAWDPSTPVFIHGRTLVIPSVFCSWTGEALDKKIPLLRSITALEEHALRILRIFGDKETQKVLPTVGAEQEYFLIDAQMYYLRPDLIACGRTLFGAPPGKGQELEDQYLGAISERVIGVMEEVEYELLKLGVPIKTRHNEVAPAQFELALSFQGCHIATDHHMLVMEILRKVAKRRGFVCLLHEKPFAGINGSGKHTNWSLATDKGVNLLEPGDSPHMNVQFLIFCAAVTRAVHKYSKLLRMSVASAGNDHRLGKHEAPPGIMSVFLGEHLQEIFEKLAKGETGAKNRATELTLGLKTFPKITKHTSDRNRTSPFAFTGNKFEFRSVGSNENISKAVTVLNTTVAESLDFFATELERDKDDLQTKLGKLLSGAAREIEPILFEGDNYSEKWLKEAEKRGLPNITNTVDAAQIHTSPESVALFTKYQVFTRPELESRESITLSKYLKKVMIEAKVASNMVHTQILPAALKHLQEVGGALQYLQPADQEIFKEVAEEIGLLRKALTSLDDTLAKLPSKEAPQYARDKILPAMEVLRKHVDRLEELVADSLWPLPKYAEMLFIL